MNIVLVPEEKKKNSREYNWPQDFVGFHIQEKSAKSAEQ